MSAITAEEMRELVARALAEDLGDGDVTGEATVPAEATATARIVQKAPGVVFGLDLVVETMSQTGVETVQPLAPEGIWRQEVPTEVLVAEGSARAILAAERTALNFLGHLSGVATLTAQLRRGGRRHRGADPRHPQDDPGAAQAGEGGGRGGRRDQPPHGPLRRLPDQGEPHRRRGRDLEGGLRGAQGPSGAAGRGRGPQPRRDRLCPRHRRRSAPARQHGPADDARRGRTARRPLDATASRPSRPPAASTWRRSARSPRPESTSSPSAPSPTRPRLSTSHCSFAPTDARLRNFSRTRRAGGESGASVGACPRTPKRSPGTSSGPKRSSSDLRRGGPVLSRSRRPVGRILGGGPGARRCATPSRSLARFMAWPRYGAGSRSCCLPLCSSLPS